MGATSSGPRVSVVGSGPGLRAEIRTGPHALVADEAADAGGADAGPSTYDLLAAALGACTSMTLRLYAARKGWPLEAVEVTVAHGKIHAEDCEGCETKVGKIDRLECRIALRGPLDDAQRARLLDIATKCPVHRTLTSEISIETKLAGGAA